MDAHPAPGSGLRVVRFGEAALLVELGTRVDETLNSAVHLLCSRLHGHPAIPAGQAPVPAYASLLVPFDPDGVDAAALATELRAAAASALSEARGAPGCTGDDGRPPSIPLGRLVEIPVRYGGDDGPDLASVAQRLGLSPDEVVALHAGTTYQVFMLGFAPGFAYLGSLPAALELPRRDEPRVRVPSGSVAITGRQTAVYPFPTPGGWHLLGRTDLRLWDPQADPPARLRPGDRVRFAPA